MSDVYRPYMDQTDLIGKVIEDRYEIESLIDEGGFGWVFKGHDHHLDGPVAIKVMQPVVGKQLYERAARRFNKEAKVLKQLQSPRTISVISSGEYVDDGGSCIYMVMEFIDGITLQQYVSRRSVLSARDFLHVMMQVLDSLDEAHQKELIHRDLKPANIMVLGGKKNAAGHLSIKVLDFGLFKAVDQSSSLANTQTQGVMLTPNYGAPEQIREGAQVGPFTDLYSLGMVGYFSLAGYNPLGDRANPTHKMQMLERLISVEDIELPTDFTPGSPLRPTPLTKVINRLLIKNLNPSSGERRYLSVDEVYRDLRPFIDNPSLLDGDRMHRDNDLLSGEKTVDWDENLLRRAIESADQKTEALGDEFFAMVSTEESADGEFGAEPYEPSEALEDVFQASFDPLESQPTTSFRAVDVPEHTLDESIDEVVLAPPKATPSLPEVTSKRPGTSSGKTWVGVAIMLILGVSIFVGVSQYSKSPGAGLPAVKSALSFTGGVEKTAEKPQEPGSVQQVVTDKEKVTPSVVKKEGVKPPVVSEKKTQLPKKKASASKVRPKTKKVVSRKTVVKPKVETKPKLVKKALKKARPKKVVKPAAFEEQIIERQVADEDIE